MSVVWKGRSRWAKDGFYGSRRVAAVQRYWDHLPETLVRAKYWMAFIRRPDFEIVLVDGKPGRWATETEARAAAEEAFDAWLAETPEANILLSEAAVAPPPEPLGVGKQVRMGLGAVLTASIASRWPSRRSGSGGDEPRPSG
jgi:hypothetical protein